MVALVVPDPDRGGIPLGPSQYRPRRRPARQSACSDLPCRWRCHEVTVGSFRYLVRARGEPPSAPCLRRGRLRHLPPLRGGRGEMEITRRSPEGERFPIPFPTSPPEGEMPRRGRGGGTAVSRSYAQASPSVAARQLPLGRPARKSPSSDPPCRWRCHEVTVGSFRYPVRRRPEPPSACGISPRRAGGEGKWGLRAGLLGGSYGKSDSADRVEWPRESGGHPQGACLRRPKIAPSPTRSPSGGGPNIPPNRDFETGSKKRPYTEGQPLWCCGRTQRRSRPCSEDS